MKYESNKGEGKLPFKTWAGVEVRVRMRMRELSGKRKRESYLDSIREMGEEARGSSTESRLQTLHRTDTKIKGIIRHS